MNVDQVIVDKIRDQFGSLLTEDQLREMVAKAVQDTFFAPRLTQPTSHWDKPVEKPSLFVEKVTELATPHIEKAAKEFVENNKTVLDKALSEFMTEHSLMLMALKQMQSAMYNDMQMAVSCILNVLGKK